MTDKGALSVVNGLQWQEKNKTMILFMVEKNFEFRFRGISGLKGTDELLICLGQKYLFDSLILQQKDKEI